MTSKLTVAPIFLSLFMLAVWTSSAQASLIGDDIRLQVSAFSTFFDETAVGDTTAVEFANVSGSSTAQNDVDIFDENTILIDLTFSSSSTAFGAGFSNRDFTFFDVDWGGAGTVVNLANFSLTDGSRPTSYTGFDLLSPTSFRINDVTMFADLDDPQATLMFDVVSSHDVAVPAPATLLLFGLGLAGIGFGLRRR